MQIDNNLFEDRNLFNLYKEDDGADENHFSASFIDGIDVNTSVEEFEEMCIAHPTYRFHYRSSSEEPLALEQAIAKKNLPLSLYFFELLDAKTIGVHNILIEILRAFNKVEIANQFLKKAISNGIDINGATLYQGKYYLHLLQSACEWGDLPLVRLLLENGAQPLKRINKLGYCLLAHAHSDYNNRPSKLKVVIEGMQRGWVEPIEMYTAEARRHLQLAQMQMQKSRYQFLLGKQDENSILSILPKEIFAQICSLAHIPDSNEKNQLAQCKIKLAIGKNCQTELLFILNRHSFQPPLPKEMIQEIMTRRIALSVPDKTH